MQNIGILQQRLRRARIADAAAFHDVGTMKNSERHMGELLGASIAGEDTSPAAGQAGPPQ